MRTDDALAYDLAVIIKKWAAEKSETMNAEQIQAIIERSILMVAHEIGFSDNMDWLDEAVGQYKGVDIQLQEVQLGSFI